MRQQPAAAVHAAAHRGQCAEQRYPFGRLSSWCLPPWCPIPGAAVLLAFDGGTAGATADSISTPLTAASLISPGDYLPTIGLTMLTCGDDEGDWCTCGANTYLCPAYNATLVRQRVALMCVCVLGGGQAGGKQASSVMCLPLPCHAAADALYAAPCCRRSHAQAQRQKRRMTSAC